MKRIILNNSNNLKSDALDYPDDLRKNEIKKSNRNYLLDLFNINLVKCIKSFDKLNLINFKILNK